MPLMPRFLLRRLLNPSARRAAAPRFSSAAATAALPSFLPDFLVNRCGLSPPQADKVFKTLAHVKSPDNPAAVLDYLRSLGLRKEDLKIVVTWHPKLLVASVDSTLRPKVDLLLAAGFSEADVVSIIGNNPSVLLFNNFKPKLEFLRTYIPDKKGLLQALHRKTRLVSSSLSQKLEPNVALLLRRGLPARNVARVLSMAPRAFTMATEHVEELIDRVERIGFAPGSAASLYAFVALSHNNKKLIEEKINVMKSFGWSEEDFYAAFRRNPLFLQFSCEGLRSKMRFLLEVVGFEHQYIVKYPNLLFRSLKTTLTPRYQVFQMLRSHGLLDVEPSAVLFLHTEAKFLKKVIVPNLQKVPTLRNVYPNACLEETDT